MCICPGKLRGWEIAVLGLFGRRACVLKGEKNPDPVRWREQPEQQPPTWGNEGLLPRGLILPTEM